MARPWAGVWQARTSMYSCTGCTLHKRRLCLKSTPHFITNCVPWHGEQCVHLEERAGLVSLADTLSYSIGWLEHPPLWLRRKKGRKFRGAKQ